MDFKDERELVSQARDNTQAFGAIYEKYYSVILHYALKRVGDVKVAEDVTSQTFLNALKNLWRFKWQNVAFSAWLYRIANNEVNLYFRNGRRKIIPLELLSENGFDLPAQVDIQLELDEAELELRRHKDFLAIREQIIMLPIKYQEVIALRFFENKKIKDIAEILGKKEGTVKSLLSRGLDMLRENWVEIQQNPDMQPFPCTRIIEK